MKWNCVVVGNFNDKFSSSFSPHRHFLVPGAEMVIAINGDCPIVFADPYISIPFLFWKLRTMTGSSKDDETRDAEAEAVSQASRFCIRGWDSYQ